MGGYAQLMEDGRVAILGGSELSAMRRPPSGAYEEQYVANAQQVKTVDVYSPIDGGWQSFEVDLPHLGTARGYLGAGRFLLLGFFDATDRSVCMGRSSNRTYILDVNRRTIVPGPDLPSPRENAMVVSEPGGNLSAIGGDLYYEHDAGGSFDTCEVKPDPNLDVLDVAVFNPLTAAWHTEVSNGSPSANLLSKVIVFGDGTQTIVTAGSIARRSPLSHSWTWTQLWPPYLPASTALSRAITSIGIGQALLLVGSSCYWTSQDLRSCYAPNSQRADIFDLASNDWMPAADPSAPYYAGASLTRLSSDRVLAIGGGDHGDIAELFSWHGPSGVRSWVYLPWLTSQMR